MITTNILNRFGKITLIDIFVIWLGFSIVNFLLEFLLVRSFLFFSFLPSSFSSISSILLSFSFVFYPFFYLVSLIMPMLIGFLSLFISMKYIYPYYYSNSDDDEADKPKPWGAGVMFVLWAMAILNIVPLFWMWVGLGMSPTGMSSLSVLDLLYGGTMPLIGLSIATFKIINDKKFSIFSFHMIPVFLCLFELHFVLRVF